MSELERNRLRVLIADDEPENAQAYARALRGYEVIMATRGDQAMAMLAEHPIDLIVTDQRMPGTSGAMLLQRARAINPVVRRVVVSATAEPEHLLEAINRGEVERYLLKPVEPERLRAVVDELATEYLWMQAERARVTELQDELQALRRSVDEPAEGELLDRIELELLRARRYRRPLSLLVFAAAPTTELRRLRGMLRELDIALRVGERLVIVLPESDTDGARLVWERLRRVGVGVEPEIRSCPEHGTSLQALLLSPRG